MSCDALEQTAATLQGEFHYFTETIFWASKIENLNIQSGCMLWHDGFRLGRTLCRSRPSMWSGLRSHQRLPGAIRASA